MRKTMYISVFILLFSFQLSGQQYRVTYSGSAGPSEPCNPDPIQISWVRIYLEDDTHSSLLLNSTCAAADNAANDEVLISFKPDRIRRHEYALHNNGMVVIDDTTITNINLNHCDSESQNYPLDNISFSIEPVIDISSASPNPTSSCNTITLSASNSGFETDMYNWEYSINGGVSWPDLPGFQGQANIDVGIDDIPGLDINQAVQFRINHCGSVPTQVITRSFNRCSPDINNFVVSNTSCSYTDDGSFTVTFTNTPGEMEVLDPGETLLLNLFQGAPPGDAGAILVDALIVNSGDLTGNSYNWPDILPANTDYYLRYQLDNDGSVYDYGPFEITAPITVTFNAIWTDVNCFGENTGSIEITAAGGTQNYQYRLNNGGWMNFSNQFTHTINGLGAGDYQIRVQDANGCTEQQIP